jgi:hypothetical protein
MRWFYIMQNALHEFPLKLSVIVSENKLSTDKPEELRSAGITLFLGYFSLPFLCTVCFIFRMVYK